MMSLLLLPPVAFSFALFFLLMFTGGFLCATLLSPPTVSAEAGIATALIPLTDQAETITVYATSSGLASGDASIVSQ